MLMKNLNDMEGKEIIPGYTGKFIHSRNVTLAYWAITASAALPEHSHPHEQVVNIIEGTMELTVKDETQTLTPGQVVIIPPNIPHSGRAVTECRVIDVFFPVREDYR